MEYTCVHAIREEHANISAILASIVAMIKRGPKDDRENFFDVLRAMLFYLNEYPARMHHPKETQYLFKPLQSKTFENSELIDQLLHEHDKEESVILELQHLLVAWENLGEDRREAFESKALRYADFYLAHMQTEERVVIPQAIKTLTQDEWDALNDAFAKSGDPLAKSMRGDPQYDRLFTKILMHAPDPIGLGRTS